MVKNQLDSWDTLHFCTMQGISKWDNHAPGDGRPSNQEVTWEEYPKMQKLSTLWWHGPGVCSTWFRDKSRH